MTLTINPKSYTQLLTFYQPKVIKNQEENERTIALANELEHKANRTSEEDSILELLITLIEKFEDEHYPIPKGTPHSMLLHLMEASGIKPEDLVEVIGSREIVSEIVNGTRGISNTHTKALAKFFSVDISLFIE